jgi:chemotaxis signal transduction protein
MRVHAVTRPSPTMLGVLDLRGALVPLHGAAAALGVAAGAVHTALVLRAGAGRLALAVDDAEDVLALDLADTRPAPHAVARGAVLGVVRQGKDLIGIVDGDALVAACRPDPSLENS